MALPTPRVMKSTEIGNKTANYQCRKATVYLVEIDVVCVCVCVCLIDSCECRKALVSLCQCRVARSLCLVDYGNAKR